MSNLLTKFEHINHIEQICIAMQVDFAPNSLITLLKCAGAWNPARTLHILHSL